MNDQVRDTHSRKVLITDFDGTLTQVDFYRCAVERVLSPQDLIPWLEYEQGRTTHFDALQRIFRRIRASESEIKEVLKAMQLEPELEPLLERLQENGWNLVIVSNGCGWYIRQMLGDILNSVTLHTNPGEFNPQHGLLMERPLDSLHYCEETGISKLAVVQTELQYSQTVAFAGDGRPDVEPALAVEPELRFCTGWLADELSRRGVAYKRFSRWREVAEQLIQI